MEFRRVPYIALSAATTDCELLFVIVVIFMRNSLLHDLFATIGSLVLRSFALCLFFFHFNFIQLNFLKFDISFLSIIVATVRSYALSAFFIVMLFRTLIIIILSVVLLLFFIQHRMALLRFGEIYTF